MNDEFQVWFPIKFVDQLTFTNQTVHVEVFGEGHIVYQGILMCGESREKLKNAFGAKKDKTVVGRPSSVKICETCARKYRANGRSPWSNWVEGNPITPAVKLPALKSLK